MAKTHWNMALAGATDVCFVIAADDGKRLMIPSNSYSYGPTGLVTTKTSKPETKKHPNLSRAKQRALYLNGYYNQFGSNMGMLYNDNIQVKKWGPEWYIWSASADGELINKIENIADYVSRTQKYANISKNFGTEVKNVFKKIEASDKIYNGVIVFGIFDSVDKKWDDSRLENDPKYKIHDGEFIGDLSGFIIRKEHLDPAKALVKPLEIKSVGKHSVAAATETAEEALMLMMSYSGKLNIRTINLTTMEEMKR